MRTISDEIIQQIQKILNDAMHDNLYGGAGDADAIELNNAAIIFKVLKLLELEIRSESDVVRTLTQENVFGDNFLD